MPLKLEHERNEQMKTVVNMAAQGDVLFRRVDALPKDAKQIREQGRIVVAHSETGHHHAIDDSGVIRFEVSDPLVCYLQLASDGCDVVHHRPYDTHETLRLQGPGVFEVRRQREHTPEGWRRVED
jgi:hypothetical protein